METVKLTASISRDIDGEQEIQDVLWQGIYDIAPRICNHSRGQTSTDFADSAQAIRLFCRLRADKTVIISYSALT